MSNWRQLFFNKLNCQGVVEYNGDGDVTVKGTVNSVSSNPLVVFWAPNPPDFRTSFSGSGLPFSTPSQAFDKTPNYGAVRAINGNFEFKLKYPNAYYTGLGTLYIPPHVVVKVCEEGQEDKIHQISLGEGVPYRTLTYTSPPTKRPRVDADFYNHFGLPVRSQEQILRDSAYPSGHVMNDDFWGLRPPK